MFSLPLGVVSRDDDDLARSMVGSLYSPVNKDWVRTWHRCRSNELDLLGLSAPTGRHLRKLSLTRGLGPWVGALVGHGDKIIQAWPGHGVEEALTFHAAKRKSLAPD